MEMQNQAQKERFGEVTHISQTDFVDDVTKAGEGVWVVLHLFRAGLFSFLIFLFYFIDVI